jgi:glutathione S-transferase
MGMDARRIGLTGIVLAVVLAVAMPAFAAGATPSRKKAIWGPVRLDGVSQFPIYRDLGAGIYMMRINWWAVAPSRPDHPRDPADPAYHWPAEVDDAIQQAGQYGMRITMELSDTPGWASGHGGDVRWAPKRSADFADFAVAAARRWPTIHLWLIWPEPTQKANFQPLISERRDRPLTRKMRRGPHRYARLLDATYGALKQESRKNLIIGGNTFTTGDVSVLNWIKNLKLPNGKPPRMDMYGHNPFNNRAPVLHGPRLGHGFIDFTDLPILARWIDRYLGRPRHRAGMKIFIAELMYPTSHRNFEFDYFVSRKTAARWLAIALRGARHWKRIYTLAWTALYDDPVRKDHLQVERGLLTRKGKKKPAYYAFRRG